MSLNLQCFARVKTKMIGVQSSQNNLRVWEFQEASQKKWFSFVLVKDTIDKQTKKQTQAQTIIKIDKETNAQ